MPASPWETLHNNENTACNEPLATVEVDVDPALKKGILSVGATNHFRG
ncbi:hypothetical protein KL86SPO_40680 [uncultured Sporomusa sp.]|uniref:Uncharacterized protein n=1 Tax=uncultured Sporomusa sp. TaxID=307249 RepID=A0A212LX70_9FIRM|nr:hypothetical protein KL86SPO_40680 [uncultured Sporomusa sp.]